MLFTSRRSFGTLVLGLVAAVGMLVASSTPLRASGPPAISGTISIAPVTSQSRVPVTIGLSNVGDSGYYMYGQATSGYLDGNGQFVDTGASEVYLEDGPIPTSGSSMTLYAVTGNKGRVRYAHPRERGRDRQQLQQLRRRRGPGALGRLSPT